MSADPNLSNEAVQFYRDTFRLCPNAGRRQDIISTVTDIELWKTVLTEWKAQKWNPLKINWMLSEYERRAKQPQRSPGSAQQPGERRPSEKDLPVGLSRGRNPEVPSVPIGKRIDVRASRGTLARIVATALQEMQQPDRPNK